MPKHLYLLLLLLLTIFIINKTDKNEPSNYLQEKSTHLIYLIKLLEDCAKPVPPYLDKVYSNLKYRSNRLRECIRMVKNGNYGFDCNRELRKTHLSYNKVSYNSECKTEMKDVLKAFNEFSYNYIPEN